jgi:hypothetical protein
MAPPEHSEASARNIVQRLQSAGFEAMYAGGCVRDMLRGVPPHDYDIATSARPEQVQALFRRTVAVGAQFGVISVMINSGDFQVATFRSDGAYSDGRHPESVHFSNAEEDARRRDFTVNGLFYDPVREQLRDYVGGRADLEAKILRAIGDPEARFAEDRLRMLRAVRFATVLGFEIEPTTWTAVRKHAASIVEVSAERIRDELLKTLHPPARVRGLDLLDQSGLLNQILPEMEALKGCEQPPQFHPEGDVWVHTRLMLSLLPGEVSTPLLSRAEQLGVYRMGAICLAEPLPRGAREVGTIQFYLDDLIVNDIALTVRGWAAATGRRATRGAVHLVLRSETATHVFSAVPASRPDVAAALRQPTWKDAGFHFARRIDRLPPGTYRVGFLIDDGERPEFTLSAHRVVIDGPRSRALPAGTAAR